MRISVPLIRLLLLFLVGSPAIAQQFSADLVRLKPEGAAPSRVFVSGDRVRFEAGSGAHLSVVVVDLKPRVGYLVIPDDKTYTMLRPGQLSPSMPFFHAVDSENACGVWETAIGKQGTCAKTGDEMINGRAAVKYTGIAANGDKGSAWVDRKLGFVIKWEGEAGAAELRNIQEHPQTATLFEIPKDYQRADSRAARPSAAKKK